MTRLIKKNLFLLLFFLFVLFFFKETIVAGLLPIPSDTIVGLYHPFLDLYAKISPAGVPFKNFLLTDPVRQIIPWKLLVIDNIFSFSLPLWNPYEMAGKPLLANFQSGLFYPLNLLLLIKPFYLSWTIFIMTQQVFGGIFLFAYLRNLKIDDRASLFGSTAFLFSGFSIAWLEWGNILHTALWLPLILLSIDKIFEHSKEILSIKYKIANIHIKNKKLLIWFLILLFASASSFFAGHLQIFFYIFILSSAYILFRWFESGKKVRILSSFAIYYLLFTIATAVQWVPTFQFISLSARSLDQNYLNIEGWFIPWQHLVQFLAPDFFGNPSTLNYWGVWNYAEFVGYIGVLGLFFAFCAFLSRKKEVLFFASATLVSLVLTLPTVISQLPFQLSIPFLSSAQPTRLVLVITFSLSVLSSLGFDYLISSKKINKRIVIGITALFFLLFLTLWAVALGKIDIKITAENLLISKRNLIFPSGIFALGTVLILGVIFVKEVMARYLLIALLLALSFYDVYRFGTKFTPFTSPSYFYPETSVIKFLKNDQNLFRVAVSDSRILAPNIATYYKIQSVEGYDPLYLLSYAELVAGSERESHSIKPPFGFNRIITPHNISSKIIDLLNVKYVLSLTDLDLPKLKKVFQEGQTRVYKNENVLPRAFFVDKIIPSGSSQNTISGMFSQNLENVAFAEGVKETNNLSRGKIHIKDYHENRIEMTSENISDGFLVFTDSFYPTWKAKIDGINTKIYRTNHAFRGVFVPGGAHKIVFYNTLF